MTLRDIDKTLIAIGAAALRRDFESAHALEDKLFRDVLAEIAKGKNLHSLLAKNALKSRELAFARWVS